MLHIDADLCAQECDNDIDGCQYAGVKPIAVLSTACPPLLAGPLEADEAEHPRPSTQGARRPCTTTTSQPDPGPARAARHASAISPSRSDSPSRRSATTSRSSSNAGLVEREQRGSWAYFRVVPGRLRSLSDLLSVTSPIRSRKASEWLRFGNETATHRGIGVAIGNTPGACRPSSSRCSVSSTRTRPGATERSRCASSATSTAAPASTCSRSPTTPCRRRVTCRRRTSRAYLDEIDGRGRASTGALRPARDSRARAHLRRSRPDDRRARGRGRATELRRRRRPASNQLCAPHARTGRRSSPPTRMTLADAATSPRGTGAFSANPAKWITARRPLRALQPRHAVPVGRGGRAARRRVRRLPPARASRDVEDAASLRPGRGERRRVPALVAPGLPRRISSRLGTSRALPRLPRWLISRTSPVARGAARLPVGR